MTPLQTSLLQIGLSLVVAVTTAWLTVWLSLRRFYREKWWEAKMRAYTDLIQALHHIKWDIEITIKAHMRGQDTDTEYFNQSGERHRAAWDEIRRQIDVGEFLYSTASVKILRALIGDPKSAPEDSYLEYLFRTQEEVEKCLPAIKASARRDLGLPTVSTMMAASN